MSSPVHSEWYRQDATRRVALHKAIEETGNPDLVGLADERDMLFMEHQMWKEIESERAAEGREIAPQDRGCDCDICAVNRGLEMGVLLARIARQYVEEYQRWFDDADEDAEDSEPSPGGYVLAFRKALGMAEFS